MPTDCAAAADLDALVRFVAGAPRLFVLTGAGCSTESGIPDYRDDEGEWKRREPIRYAEFVRSATARQRYWARSLVGFPAMDAAQPSASHAALAGLESDGRIERLVTQNVDGLHQAAGSERVIDLHGRVSAVTCLGCSAPSERADLQRRLVESNPGWADAEAALAPDGDADLERETGTFEVPACRSCGGVLKPDLVFFGENVPAPRVADAYAALEQSDALLVAGTSLMLFSGLRFVRAAVAQGMPIAIINRGRTRADEHVPLRVAASCGATLAALQSALA
jgi:NAD-dependent SIR2 family protein deacetylase